MKKSNLTKRIPLRIGIIGSGICGSVVAKLLKDKKGLNTEVVIFDWGRSSGGRLATRTFALINGKEDFNASKALLRFDHGCQFIRAQTPFFNRLLEDLENDSAVLKWKPEKEHSFLNCKTRTFLSNVDSSSEGFFQVHGSELGHIYICPEGMNSLCKQIQMESKAKVNQHTRVREIKLAKDNLSFALLGDAADHQEFSNDRESGYLGNYDAVVVTDHLTVLPEWHPCCLHGLKEIEPSCIRDIRRFLHYDSISRRFEYIAPLFTLMLAFDSPVSIPISAISFLQSDILQFGFLQNTKFSNIEPGVQCWVLVSTVEFAEQMIKEEPLSKEKDNSTEYKPQREEYLKGKPALSMYKAFEDALSLSCPELPKLNYARCQRWGSAYPKRRPEPTWLKKHFFDYNVGKNLRLYFCGDFMFPNHNYNCAENAAISAKEVVDQITDDYRDTGG